MSLMSGSRTAIGRPPDAIRGAHGHQLGPERGRPQSSNGAMRTASGTPQRTEPETTPRHCRCLGAHQLDQLALEVDPWISAQDLADVLGGHVPDAKPGSIDHRSPLQVAAERSVPVGRHTRVVWTQIASASASARSSATPALAAHASMRSALAQREIAARSRMGHAEVVNERTAVEQLVIELVGDRRPPRHGRRAMFCRNAR